MLRPAATRSRRHRQSGFALVTVALSLVSLVGTVGLGVDIGRMYIAKSEAQAVADSAALAAALELDGTPQGIARARQAASAAAHRQAEFSVLAEGPFVAVPKFADGVRFVRVTAEAPVDIYFLRVTGAPATSTARASAVAGQVEKTNFREGLFPFAVVTPEGGLVPAGRYALGYVESSDDAAVRPAVLSELQTRPVALGDSLPMTAPRPDTVLQALGERLTMDADPSSATYAAYNGNGRRLVAVPVLSADNRVEGFAAVFLPPASDIQALENLTAEYVGPWVQGSHSRGAADTPAGAYVVRLVQ
ncbi:MAG: hypothetical protein JNK87_32725 [Bryobacterales bacterium]|nr:hypothetical protein [Bryobacterales bacterium]